MVKQIKGGKKKVSKKKKTTQTYKWIKQQFAELDELKERLTKFEERLKLIEWFLGGTKSMEKVKKNNVRPEH